MRFCNLNSSPPVQGPANHASRSRTVHGRGLALSHAMLLFLVTSLPTPAIAQAASADPFAHALEMLNQASFVKKAEAIKTIERSGHPQGLPVLRALLHGDLHARVEDGRFFIVKEKGGEFELIDALSGEVTVTPRVTLAPGARFIGWEVLCLGRPAAGERFDAGLCRQRFELWSEDRPLLIERSTIAGGSDLLRAPWGFGGRTVSGTFLATPADPTMLGTVREAVAVEGEDLFSATLLDSVLLCRYLGDGAESARRFFTDAWRAVRPGVLGREAQPPRIWRT